MTIPYQVTLITANPAYSTTLWLLADGVFVPHWTSPDIVEVRNPLGIEGESYIDVFGSGSLQLETQIFLNEVNRGKFDLQLQRTAVFSTNEVSYNCVVWKTGSYERMTHPDDCTTSGYRVPVIFKKSGSA
jgi:hypothetical protein